MELRGKTSKQVQAFITSALEIKRAIGIMYGQKTIVGLGEMGEEDIGKLKLAMENGRARKVITKEQYDKLNLDKEYILQLRKNGIEIYIDNSKNNLSEQDIIKMKENGITGLIITEKGEPYIYDFYSTDKTKILEIKKGSKELMNKSLEQIIISSDKPIFVSIELLKEQFKQSNISTVQREFGALLGKIKMNLRVVELNAIDVENMLYAIDYDKIPELDLQKEIQKYNKQEIETMLTSIISNIGENSEIGIILKNIRNNKKLKEEDVNKAIKIIKERILAKTALKKAYKENGLKDKKLEILLGQMLLKQLDIQDKQEINLKYKNDKGVEENVVERNFMEKIMQDTEKAMRNDDYVAINTIIDIILTYGDDKERQVSSEADKEDIRKYRAMLSAA